MVDISWHRRKATGSVSTQISSFPPHSSSARLNGLETRATSTPTSRKETKIAVTVTVAGTLFPPELVTVTLVIVSPGINNHFMLDFYIYADYRNN